MFTIGRLTNSKIKHWTTSGRWYKARILSQEGAICVIDTGSTVLRVNQSKLWKEKLPGDTTESRGSYLSVASSMSLPRERPDILEDRLQYHPAPDVYWIIPQHISVDVMD